MDAEALIVELEPVTRAQAYLLAARRNALSLVLDCRQAARIALWQAAHKAPAEDLHRMRWGTVVIKRAVTDELRLEFGRTKWPKPRRVEVEDIEALADRAAPCSSAGTVAARQLIDAVVNLPPARQRILSLMLEGLTDSEIARALGVSPTRVWQQKVELQAWIGRYL